MFKRISILVSIFVLVFIIVGCSNTPSNNSSQSSNSSSGQSQLFTSNKWVQNEVTKDVPVPEFSVEPTEVIEQTNSFRATYENVPENEVVSWVEAVKNAGFTYMPSETKKNDQYSYMAMKEKDVLYDISVNYSADGTLKISVGYTPPLGGQGTK